MITNSDVTSIKNVINRHFNPLEDKINDLSKQTLNYIINKLENVPDTSNPENINYWIKLDDNLLLYIEGWSDECLSGTGFPKIDEGGTEEKLNYIRDLTPKILKKKAEERNLRLITGDFYETSDKINLYGITYGIYNTNKKIGIYTIEKSQIDEMIKIFHESSDKGIEYVSNLCVNPSKNLNLYVHDTCHGTECEAKIISVCKKGFVLIGDYHTHVTEDGEDIPSILDLKLMYEHKYPVECIGSTKNNTIKCYTRKDMKIKSNLFFIRLWIDTLEAIIKLTELDKTRPENFLEDSNFEVRNILKKHFIETLIYSNLTKNKYL